MPTHPQTRIGVLDRTHQPMIPVLPTGSHEGLHIHACSLALFHLIAAALFPWADEYHQPAASIGGARNDQRTRGPRP